MQRPVRRSTMLIALASLAAAPLLGVAGPARAAANPDTLIMRTGSGTSEALSALAASGGSGSYRLPLGILDRTGRTLYAASTDARTGGTLVRAIDVATGSTLRRVTIDGQFSTRSGDYAVGSVPLPGTYGTPRQSASSIFGRFSAPAWAGSHMPAAASAASIRALPAAAAIVATARLRTVARSGWPADGSQVLSALSFNGRWLALRATNSDQTTTRIAVIDTAAMRVVSDHWLAGPYGLDAISNDGKLLYLIESLPKLGFGVYQVRSYEVARKYLDPKPVVSPGETPGSMSGEAWTRAWSPDGSWLYTLYVQNSGHVFIHALHVSARQTRCIDFPAISNSVTDMSHFTLSVAPDGRRLYAVNPVLGRVVAIDHLPQGKVTMATLPVQAGSPQRTQTGAAMSADGRLVFVATGSGVWAIDTHSLRLATAFLSDQEIASIALSADGTRLYALSPTSQQITVLDPASGQITDGMSPDAGAWSIEQVASSGL